MGLDNQTSSTMNQQLIEALMELLRPVLKNRSKAEQRLQRYWADKAPIIWTAADIHRAANEIKTVLTEPQARQLLHQLISKHNPQYGIRWEDLGETIQQSGQGRDITAQE